jgi:hypothetical protein
VDSRQNHARHHDASPRDMSHVLAIDAEMRTSLARHTVCRLFTRLRAAQWATVLSRAPTAVNGDVHEARSPDSA